MKNIFISVVLLCSLSSGSQDLSQVRFTGGSTLSYFSFITDQKIIIRISEQGKIIEWGNLWEQGQFNYYPGKLQPYMGRVEYYGTEADSISRGKVKSIGTCFITYYGAFEMENKRGKVKSIGRIYLDYFSNFENEASEGKLKSAGTSQFTYYNSFDNDAFKGKLKSVGVNQVIYYSSFDDKKIQGKIKSIGNASYSWYNSNDRREFQGGLKSGSVEQLVGGINYIIL